MFANKYGLWQLITWIIYKVIFKDWDLIDIWFWILGADLCSLVSLTWNIILPAVFCRSSWSMRRVIINFLDVYFINISSWVVIRIHFLFIASIRRFKLIEITKFIEIIFSLLWFKESNVKLKFLNWVVCLVILIKFLIELKEVNSFSKKLQNCKTGISSTLFQMLETDSPVVIV